MTKQFSLSEVKVSSTPTERFEEFLQSRGMRITRQRKAIVEEIFSQHEHFDAEVLLGRLQEGEQDVKVSRPTVYRTLNELEEAGLLRKMVLGGRSVYEHDYGYPQHDHLYCERCGDLIEFQTNQIDALREEVAKAHGFRVTGHRMIIFGVCQSCSVPRKRRSRPLDLI
ncbi:Ferric uptake regulation protein FUR [Planctomycetales bacterium 10988]|nr:Ferric uptake regulation protein FUR [Planctomycetales bacterium 10988]